MATEIEDLRAWLAAAPTPVVAQADAYADAIHGERRWGGDATATCRLGAVEGSLAASTLAESTESENAVSERISQCSLGGGLRTFSDDGLAAGLHMHSIASGAGSHGDQRFADIDADAFFRAPLGRQDALLVWGRYATQRMWWRHPLVPGAGWAHDSGENLWFVLGFPLAAAIWQATPALRVSAAVGDPWHAGIDYRLATAWSASLNLDWRHDGYRLGQVRGSDLLVREDLRLAAGLAWTPEAWLELDANGGWGFRRRDVVRDAATADAISSSMRPPGLLLSAGAYMYF